MSAGSVSACGAESKPSSGTALCAARGAASSVAASSVAASRAYPSGLTDVFCICSSWSALGLARDDLACCEESAHRGARDRRVQNEFLHAPGFDFAEDDLVRI